MSAGVRWLDAPAAAAGWRGEPLAWVVGPTDPRRIGWLAAAPPTAADLAEFAGRTDAAERIERRRLTRLLIASATGRHSGEPAVHRDPRGAPIVHDGIAVSVAGSGGWTAIALSAGAIGIDIEADDAAPPLWDMLAPGEAAAIRAAADPARAWLRCWVAKEAHAKRLGDPRRADPATILVRDGRARSPQGTSRVEIEAWEGATAAVALATDG